MAKTVVGLFDRMNEAQNVVQELVNQGFSRNDISLLANDTSGDYARSLKSNTTGTTVAKDEGERTAEAAGAGAVGGTVVGGVIGLLVGIGALAIPGIGPVIAAGPLAAALGSTALGAGIGAAAGGLVGALVGLGVPEEEANYYNEGVRRGGTLVTVKADDDMADRAYSIMQRFGAVDIKERGRSWVQEGWSGRDPSDRPTTSEVLDWERDHRATQ